MAAAAEGAGTGGSGGGAGAGEEPVVSLAEVLAENEELEKEARAVLGGSDHERCSYSQVRAGPGAGPHSLTPRPGAGRPLPRCVPAGRREAPGSIRLQHLHAARRRARRHLPGVQLRVPRLPPPPRALHQEVPARG